MSNDARRESILNTLKKQIQDYEPRLVNVTLEVNVKQAEFQGMAGRQLRRRIEIVITAALGHSNEPFRFQTGFFIGPLSFD
jgi:predicted component of type VI protein secretion system